MPETTTLHLGVGLDTRDFARFAKALRLAAPDLRRALLLRLRAAGQVVAEEARARVLGSSTTVPQSIKVRISGATVSVVAGGADVPLGGLLELGNKGNRKGDPTEFSHPVFGNKAVWVKQPTRPYLAPAVRDKIAEVERLAVEALDEAIARVVSGG